jgi:hypothetical protein
MPGGQLSGLDSLRHGGQQPRILERIARADEPPDPIEMETFHGEQACGTMPGMRRVETAAKKADP